jgi:hypothetical protein
LRGIRERRISLLESVGGGEKLQAHPCLSLAGAARDNELGFEALDARQLKLVEMSRIDRTQQVVNRIEGTGLEHHLGCRQNALDTSACVWRQHRRTFEKGRCRSKSPTRLRARRCLLELGRHLLVWSRCCLRSVPRPSIRVEFRIGCVGERAVGKPSLAQRCCAIHGRTNERMEEVAPLADLEEAGVLGRIGRPDAQAEARCSADEQKRIAQRLRRREEQQLARVVGEQRQLASEAVFDPRGERVVRLTNDPGGRFGGPQRSGELDQRERISVRLGE